MSTPSDFNCHHDPEHVKRTNTTIEDINNIIDYATHFKMCDKSMFSSVLDRAKKLKNDPAMMHHLVHETMWIFLNHIAGNEALSLKHKEFTGKDARDHLAQMEHNCIIGK